MNWQRVFGWGMVLLLLVVFLTPLEAGAMPGFARRYKISCSTCHAPMPKLKPYGDEFAGRGFVIPEEERERDYVTEGDDLLWLNRDFPIGARFDAYAVYDQDEAVETDLQTPWGLKLISGGPLYHSIGYYFYFYLSERGEVAGIEDAYVHFDNVFDSQLDVMVGQFQTSDPLMKRELRLTFEDYWIYKQRIGLSRTNLAYDRGIMLPFAIPATGTDLVAMVVNGNGKPAAGDKYKFDHDKYKNVAFRLRQAVGDLFSVGGYVYWGKERLAAGATNEVTYWGPDVHATAGPLELNAQYLRRIDTDPLAGDPLYCEDIDTDGIVAELILAPRRDRSRYYFTLLYNLIDSELDDYDYETLTLSGTTLVARNLRLLAEYTYDWVGEKNRVALGLVSGF